MGKALELFCECVENMRNSPYAAHAIGMTIEANAADEIVREIRALQRVEKGSVVVYATDAVVTFGPAGVTLQAPLVEMHGDVTVTA